MTDIIRPFDPGLPEVQSNLSHILKAAPVRNLTDAEVLTTIRLLQLHLALMTGTCKYSVCIHKQDKRLAECSDEDRFLAMLLDCDLRDVLLGCKMCRRLFGGTDYHWRKIARKSPITATASAISEIGSGYYGRGWIIAPHIQRLRRWIIANCQNPEIKRLK